LRFTKSKSNCCRRLEEVVYSTVVINKNPFLERKPYFKKWLY